MRPRVRIRTPAGVVDRCVAARRRRGGRRGAGRNRLRRRRAAAPAGWRLLLRVRSGVGPEPARAPEPRDSVWRTGGGVTTPSVSVTGAALVEPAEAAPRCRLGDRSRRVGPVLAHGDVGAARGSRDAGRSQRAEDEEA